jgi:hypothetical protein
MSYGSALLYKKKAGPVILYSSASSIGLSGYLMAITV